MESFSKDIEFSVNVGVDLEEGVTGVQMAVQVIATEDPVFEDSLLEKLDNILEKKAVGGAVRWALRINDHKLLTSCFIDSIPSPSRTHHFYIPVIELWRQLRVMIAIQRAH
jgi:hypothetical protein